MTTENKMREVLVDSVTLNIGSGTEAEGTEKAISLLSKISGKKVIKSLAKKRIPTWKIRPGLPIGARVKMRGKETIELLRRLLTAVDFALPRKSFTVNGFSFGIKEYVDIPEVKYDPKIGIIGLDVIVSLKRRGFRVARRKIKKAKIGSSHIITGDEAFAWAQAKFGVKEREKE
ncbi:MAG: 50S ribosomal protein L5 [DPANN group archaeon]|jgi:large subunit ribosomal protein L5|nr:50S ribosomal protein L5 [DPANN group archaeon]